MNYRLYGSCLSFCGGCGRNFCTGPPRQGDSLPTNTITLTTIQEKRAFDLSGLWKRGSIAALRGLQSWGDWVFHCCRRTTSLSHDQNRSMVTLLYIPIMYRVSRVECSSCLYVHGYSDVQITFYNVPPSQNSVTLFLFLLLPPEHLPTHLPPCCHEASLSLLSTISSSSSSPS